MVFQMPYHKYNTTPPEVRFHKSTPTGQPTHQPLPITNAQTSSHKQNAQPILTSTTNYSYKYTFT